MDHYQVMVVNRYTDNGEFSHYELIDSEGKTVLSQETVDNLEQRVKELEEENLILLKQNIQFPRLLGEFHGTLEGIVAWEIPEELKIKIQEKIKELESNLPKNLKGE